MHRLSRAFVLLIAFAILYSGPVAACVCANDPSMPAMPCCPDQAHHAGQADLGIPPSLGASCAPIAVSLLPVAAQDVPAPVAIVAAAPEPWAKRAPPPLPSIARPAPLDTPPIYLITLRLRN